VIGSIVEKKCREKEARKDGCRRKAEQTRGKKYRQKMKIETAGN
jgi:hypothetical protein